MGLISAWWNGSQSQICLLTSRHCCLTVLPVQPYLHLQIVNSLRGCAGIPPFKSTKHSASIVLCAQSVSKEISLLKNHHICQQFPVPAPHQQVLCPFSLWDLNVVLIKFVKYLGDLVFPNKEVNFLLNICFSSLPFLFVLWLLHTKLSHFRSEIIQ